MKLLSRVRLFATWWTVAHPAPPSMEFSRQEYTGVGCHFLLQGIFLTQGSNPGLGSGFLRRSELDFFFSFLTMPHGAILVPHPGIKPMSLCTGITQL